MRISRAAVNLNSCYVKLNITGVQEVDSTAHSGDWDAYLRSIRIADTLAFELWNWIQASPVYGDGATAFVISSDHGRHYYNFAQHGDGCFGCRSIPFVAIGPDFLVGVEVGTPEAEQTDLCPTLAYLLGLGVPYVDGRIMGEILTTPPSSPAAPVASIALNGGPLRLSWGPVTQDENGASIADVTYRVYRGTHASFPADSDHLLSWGLTDTMFIDTDPSAVGDTLMNFSYVVRAAQWEVNVSDWSNKVGEFDYALP